MSTKRVTASGGRAHCKICISGPAAAAWRRRSASSASANARDLPGPEERLAQGVRQRRPVQVQPQPHRRRIVHRRVGLLGAEAREAEAVLIERRVTGMDGDAQLIGAFQVARVHAHQLD